jgi:hypothetical protein
LSNAMVIRRLQKFGLQSRDGGIARRTAAL